MKNNQNNRRKKPIEGKDYKVTKGKNGTTTVFNLRHPDNAHMKEESEDILDMIRARQEQSPSNDSGKLREFLANLKGEGTVEEDYSDSPIYKMGWEDGETAGYEIASQRYKDELRSLRTMIDAMIDSK